MKVTAEQDEAQKTNERTETHSVCRWKQVTAETAALLLFDPFSIQYIFLFSPDFPGDISYPLHMLDRNSTGENLWATAQVNLNHLTFQKPLEKALRLVESQLLCLKWQLFPSFDKKHASCGQESSGGAFPSFSQPATIQRAPLSQDLDRRPAAPGLWRQHQRLQCGY